MRWTWRNLVRSSVFGRWRPFLCMVWSSYFLGSILILAGSSANMAWKLVDLRSRISQTGGVNAKAFRTFGSRVLLGLKILKYNRKFFYCCCLHFSHFCPSLYSSMWIFRFLVTFVLHFILRCEFSDLIFSNYFSF